MPAPRTRRRAALPALVRTVRVTASAVLLGVGSAILVVATSASSASRKPARAVSGSGTAGAAQPVTPVVTRSELPRRIAGGFTAQTESADAQSHAA